MLKRILGIFLFSLLALNVNSALAATRTWDGGSSVDNNWSTKENWSDDTVPIDGDDVLFDATTTDPCTVDVSVSLGLGDITGDAAYQGSITQSSAVSCTDIILNGPGWTGTANVTCSGNFTVGGSTVTLGGTCAITGALSRTSGSLTLSSGTTTVRGGFSGTFTHNSGTVVLYDTQTVNTGSSFNNLTLSAPDSTERTITLSADVTVTGTMLCSRITTLTGSNLYLQGHITGVSATYFGGTTAITINGGANQTWTGNGGGISTSDLTINKSGGTLTLVGTCIYQNGTFTYTAGTVDTTTGTSKLKIGSGFGAVNTTLNLDGIDWYDVEFRTGGGTTTLSSDLSVDGTLSVMSSGVVNSNEIYLSGSLTMAPSGGEISTGSTVKLIFDGTGTWSGASAVRCNVDINTTGTLTLSGTITKNTNSLVYIAGTVVTTGSKLQSYGTVSLDLDGVILNDFNVYGTTTLLSNLDVDGDFIMTGTAASSALNGFQMNVAGDITFGSSGYIASASTTQIVYDGTGTWSSAGGAKLGAPLEINTLGTLTISGNVYYDNTFIYTAGTVVTTGSTLNLTGTTSLDSDGISWNNVSVNTGVITLAGALDVNGNLTIGSKLTTSGNQINCGGNFIKELGGTFTHGDGIVSFDTAGTTSIVSGDCTFYKLNCHTPLKTISFQSGNTQTITNTLSMDGVSRTTKIILGRNGGSGTDRWTFDVSGGAQTVHHVNVANSNASSNDITALESKNSGNNDTNELTPHWIISGSGGQVIMCE